VRWDEGMVGCEGVGGGERPTDQAKFSAYGQLQAHLHADIVSLTKLFCLEVATFHHQQRPVSLLA
jgi:hypothetical protein